MVRHLGKRLQEKKLPRLPERITNCPFLQLGQVVPVFTALAFSVPSILQLYLQGFSLRE